AGLPLMAQHIDTVNLQTLLDIFKAQEESCLLGTDAVRDGIDVPGKSLRMIVFDRVPWHRPDIAHKARKAAFGEAGEAYNLMLVRMKLRQAFGRLIRKKDDKGVFVLLDRAVPSETLTAFPEGTTVEKIGLKEAVESIKEFFKNKTCS
ncbi:MAG: ATP-dependent DNA helicase, partial [Alphaproteobacteria bacterium]|nr:ATP-dependent DNA helicase [Alphaproteobacteria bacterium]